MASCVAGMAGREFPDRERRSVPESIDQTELSLEQALQPGSLLAFSRSQTGGKTLLISAAPPAWRKASKTVKRATSRGSFDTPFGHPTGVASEFDARRCHSCVEMSEAGHLFRSRAREVLPVRGYPRAIENRAPERRRIAGPRRFPTR